VSVRRYVPAILSAALLGCASAASHSPRSAVEVVTPPPVPGCYDDMLIVVATPPEAYPQAAPPEPVKIEIEPTRFDDLAERLRGYATRCHGEWPDASGPLAVRVTVMPNGELARVEAEPSSLPPALVACVTSALEKTTTSPPSGGCDVPARFSLRF